MLWKINKLSFGCETILIPTLVQQGAYDTSFNVWQHLVTAGGH